MTPLGTPRPRPLRSLRRESGQTAAEYLGLLVVVGVVLAAILASPLGGRVTELIEAAICAIGGGPCEEVAENPGEPDYPCVTSRTTADASLGVTVGFIDVGGGKGFKIEEFSNGEVKVSFVDTSSAGVSTGLEAGGALDIGDRTIGLEAGVEGNVAIDAAIEDTRVFESREDADSYVRDRLIDEGIDVLPPGVEQVADLGRGLVDLVTGHEREEGEEDSRQAEVGINKETEASATAGPATIEANRAVGGSGRITVEADGTVKAALLVDAEAGASAGVPILAEFGAAGSGQVILEGTWSPEGELIGITVIGEVAGSTDGGLIADAGDLDGLLRNLKTTATVEDGTRTTIRADLDLTDPELRESASAFLANAPRVGQPVPDMAALGESAEDLRDGVLGASTVSVAEYETSGFGVGGEGKLRAGIGLKGDAGVETAESRLTDAYYYDPLQGQFVPWVSCTG